MSTVDRARTIRAALKAKGWTSRDVSVRSDLYSMGSSIDIRIKNPAVPKSAVKAIAEPHESISRCEFSGEILSGGNRYVSVSYASDALAAFKATWLPAVSNAVAVLAVGRDNSLIPVEGTHLLVGIGRHGFAVWSDHHLGEFYDIGSVAEFVGAVMADKGEA